ncbi:hypothetical protein [Sinorhizobium meliloti]|uniref:hypothetical protein n=1 Tax=Rhizobium meliloti TaxID=382 RepID=UPI001F206BBE|nr:hypothetical protein [Sinorhizobium meliloti]
MLHARGIDLKFDATFPKFVECGIHEFRLKFSEMSGGTGLDTAFAFHFELLSKCFQSWPSRRLAGFYARPVASGWFWNLKFLTKLSDGDVGDPKTTGDFGGRALPHHCEEFFSRQVTLRHTKILAR